MPQVQILAYIIQLLSKPKTWIYFPLTIICQLPNKLCFGGCNETNYNISPNCGNTCWWKSVWKYM